MATSYAAPRQAEKVEWDLFKQRTLGKSVTIEGRGLFTGEYSSLTLHPADPETGLLFQRRDLPGAPIIPADLDHVISTPRCTVLGDRRCTIHTVEHLLSALHAFGVSNALLELSGPEIPILDGSGKPFMDALRQADIQEQDASREVHYLENPVSWTDGNVHLIALPAKEFTVSFTMHFPQSKLLGSQYYQAQITPEHFLHEIAPSRTFCLYEEIAPFIEQGLIKGGGLDNAVIIKNDTVINPDGVRFENEMVRHKVLDLVGDLALIPTRVIAHIISIRSGHASNIAFARKLRDHILREKS